MKKLIKHTSLLTFGLLLCVVAVSSQGLQIPDYEEKLTYTEFETDYYVLDQSDLDNVSLSDKVKFKELKYERDYEKYLDASNDRTTIIKHISTENVYEDWMEEPEVVVVDKEGVRLLSHEGKELNYIEHAPTYLKLIPQHEIGLLPNFAIPSEEQFQKWAEAGLMVEDLGEGFIRITNQSIQSIFNADQRYVERNKLNEAGEVMHSLKIEYMELPSGEYVYERIRESTIVELDNNIQAEHVYLRLFSNYNYEVRMRNSSAEMKKESLSILTDNDQSTAILKYTPFGNSKTSSITLFTTTGRVVKSYAVENSGENQLNISDLTPGVYIIRIQSGGKTLAEKFIKM